MTQPSRLDPAVRAALDLARDVLAELDLDMVFARLLGSACELSGATYAAIGVLDESRQRLARFVTTGVDGETREAIGPPPHGSGILGQLISNPRPLRVGNIGEHPGAAGFPPGHPPMTSFLGVPIMVGDTPVGNLYLTDKAGGGEFTEQDEMMLTILSEFAGVAIDHAQRYSGLDEDRAELQQTLDALNAALQISHSTRGTNIDTTLELIAVRGQALKWRRAMVIEQPRDGENGLVVILSD